MSELFTHNYDYLHTVAERITRKRDYRMAPELLSTTYLTIFEKQSRGTCIIPLDNDGFVKWFCTCMKNYFDWPNSSFNKCQLSKESLTIDIDYAERRNLGERNGPEEVHNRCDEFIIDKDAQLNVELSAENISEATRKFIEELTHLNNKSANRYVELIEFKRTLDQHEAVLFELFYENGMSSRSIAKACSTPTMKVNYQSINKMVNIIKSKIREYEWKQLNS